MRMRTTGRTPDTTIFWQWITSYVQAQVPESADEFDCPFVRTAPTLPKLIETGRKLLKSPREPLDRWNCDRNWHFDGTQWEGKQRGGTLYDLLQEPKRRGRFLRELKSLENAVLFCSSENLQPILFPKDLLFYRRSPDRPQDKPPHRRAVHDYRIWPGLVGNRRTPRLWPHCVTSVWRGETNPNVVKHPRFPRPDKEQSLQLWTDIRRWNKVFDEISVWWVPDDLGAVFEPRTACLSVSRHVYLVGRLFYYRGTKLGRIGEHYQLASWPKVYEDRK